MAANDPKRQHYFPRTVMENFLAPGEKMLHVYDLPTQSFSIRPLTGIAVEQHLYTLVDQETGNKNFVIELALGPMEGAAKLALDKLSHEKELTNKERSVIAKFAAYQVLRTPSMLAHIKKLSEIQAKIGFEENLIRQAALPPDEFSTLMKDISRSSGIDMADVTPDFLSEVATSGQIKVEFPKNHVLSSMFKIAQAIGEHFYSKGWKVLHASQDKGFIGSDSPIFQMRDRALALGTDSGPGAAGIANMMVFSRDASLLISERSGPGVVIHKRVSPRGRRAINQMTMATSDRLIYSHSRKLLEATVKRAGAPLNKPRFTYDETKIRQEIQRRLK